MKIKKMTDEDDEDYRKTRVRKRTKFYAVHIKCNGTCSETWIHLVPGPYEERLIFGSDILWQQSYGNTKNHFTPTAPRFLK